MGRYLFQADARFTILNDNAIAFTEYLPWTCHRKREPWSNDYLTHENFDFRGFDVPDLKAVTLASSSDGDQSKQPKTKHEDASEEP